MINFILSKAITFSKSVVGYIADSVSQFSLIPVIMCFLLLNSSFFVVSNATACSLVSYMYIYIYIYTRIQIMDVASTANGRGQTNGRSKWRVVAVCAIKY